MHSKMSKNPKITFIRKRLFQLFGGSALILFGITLFLFVSVIWKRDSITAHNLIELLLTELLVPHKSPFIYIFTSATLAGKYITPKLSLKHHAKIAFIAAITITCFFQFKNIGRWLVIRNLVSGFKITSYSRNPGQFFDVMPYCDIHIENNDMKAKDLEALINSRINKSQNLIQAFGYGKHPTAKIWIS